MYSKNLLSLADARAVGEAALAAAMETPDRAMVIAVMDAMGELVYYVKMDNASMNFSKMAMNKAYTVIHWGSDTGDIGQFLKKDNKTISDFVDPRFTTVGGGVCLKGPDGIMIGAIGTSGHVPGRDKYSDTDIAKIGAKALSL